MKDESNISSCAIKSKIMVNLILEIKLSIVLNQTGVDCVIAMGNPVIMLLKVVDNLSI